MARTIWALGDMFTIGEWLFDPNSRSLLKGGTEHRLSPKAAGVLQALAETPRQVWSRDALLERAWPNVIVGEEVLTHAIAELRSALGDDFRAPTYIETVHKSGYRAICHVAQSLGAESTDLGPDQSGCDGRDGFDLSAYAAYLQANDLFARRGRASLESALRAFATVLEWKREFAHAHVGMAKTLAYLAQYHAPRPGAVETALNHCSLARRLDPTLAEAFAVEGMIQAMFGDGGRARRLFRSAILLKPDSNETHYLLGRACFAHLEPRLAAPMLERAAALRGDDYDSLVLAGVSSEMIGDHCRARSNYILALPRLEARLAAFPGEYGALRGKAHCLVVLGRIAEVEPLLEQLYRHSDPIRHSPACILARMGESRKALDVLEESVDQGWRHAAWLRRDPCLQSLRETGRFRRIARSIGTA